MAYTHCAASQGYAPANYELGAYYKIVEHNFPKALVYYQASVSQGQECGFFLSRVFGSETPRKCNVVRPDEKLREAYYSIYKSLKLTPTYVSPI